jgi:hypothetical protein
MPRNPARKLQENSEVNPAEIPQEAGGEGSPSLFDFSGDARVRVQRKDDRTQKMVTHGYFPPNVADDDVLKEFGGGFFRAQLLVPDEQGREQIKRTRDFVLPGPYKAPTGELPGIGSRAPGAPKLADLPRPMQSASPGMADMAGMLNATMLTTFMDMIKTMKDISSRPAPVAPAVDPMLVEMMRGQAAVQTKVLELLLTPKPNNDGNSKKEILELLASMKELVAPPAAQSGDPNAMLTSIVEAMKQLRGVAEEFNPQPTPTDPMDILPKLAEVAIEEHNMRKQRAAQGQPVNRSPGQPQPAVEVSTLPIYQQVLRREAPRLISAAQAGRSAELVADIAVEFMPPNIKGVITEFFHHPLEEVIANVTTEIPMLAQYPQWVGEFVERAQELLFPDEFTDDAEEVGQPGEQTGEVSS